MRSTDVFLIAMTMIFGMPYPTRRAAPLDGGAPRPVRILTGMHAGPRGGLRYREPAWKMA